MDGTLILHILLVIVFFLAILVCRMYCRNRHKHKTFRFVIAGVHPLRVSPVIESTVPIHTMSEHVEQGLGGVYLPGAAACNCLNYVQSTAHTVLNELSEPDQISLESHTIDAESNFSIAEEIKSPPPPYSADLPSYEEAIRWSRAKIESETSNNNTS